MGRIRINELARELEIKPGVILKLLPEVGITEKKTHSSSVEGEQADQIRRKLGRLVKAAEETKKPPQSPSPAEGDIAPPAESEKPAASTAAPAAAPAISSKATPPLKPPADAPVAGEDTSPAEAAPPQGLPGKRPAPRPLRPPLASGKGAATIVPTQPPPQIRPARTVKPPPRVKPATPPKPAGIPAKPVPCPKPGQILA